MTDKELEKGFSDLVNVVKKIDERMKDLENENENEICIGDFKVLSTGSNLNECEACINRLIDKHKGFAEHRSKLNVFRNMGVG